jgi:hypothetical protein
MMKLCLVGLLLFASQSHGQVSDPMNVPRDTLAAVGEIAGSDNLFGQFQNESDDLQLLDDLTWRQEHPYDLNTITKEELASIPGITPFDVATFIGFRDVVRKFTTVEQLRMMKGIGDELYEKLSPYVTVKKEVNLVELRSRTSRDLQPRRGDLDRMFVGSSVKTYSRLSMAAGDIQAGALFEKDGGEPISNGFVSGYAAVKDLAVLSQVLIGDYNVAAGQGLVLWRGTSFGKGSEAVAVAKKSGLGVQPYRSTDEFNFFRGIAGSSSFGLGFGRFEATAFFSRRILDATIDNETVSSFYEEGYFRTENELQKQKALVEQVAGGRLQVVGANGWSVGSTFFRSTFDKPLISNRAYEFAGKEQSVVGFDAAVTMGSISAFGEIARSGDRAVAGVIGTILNISGKSNIALAYRDYAPAFNNFHASGFGERSETKNERGFYFGVDVQTLRWLKLSGYVDHFKFPWRTYSDPLPTSGHEILAQADAVASSRLNLSARLAHKSIEGTEADVDPFGRETRPIVNRVQDKYRLTVSYKATPRVHVKGRLEFTAVDHGQIQKREQGYLLFQDIRYEISKRFSIQARLIFFETDSYDSRLYEYENDLRGVFSNPALYGKGRRWYLVVHYNIASMLKLSAKYAETQKEAVTSMGSGVSEVMGDLDNRLSLQLDIVL